MISTADLPLVVTHVNLFIPFKTHLKHILFPFRNSRKDFFIKFLSIAFHFSIKSVSCIKSFFSPN